FHLARNGRSFLIYFALLAIKLLSGVSFCKNLKQQNNKSGEVLHKFCVQDCG
ncbi:hypothetical protein AAKU61_002818, partial [Undibacterium sp. GrIS 1.2]